MLGLSTGFHSSSLSRQFRGRALQLSMITPIRSGSIVALVTPMTKTNEIDYPKLESLLKWHIAEGMARWITFVRYEYLCYFASVWYSKQ